VFPPCRIFPLPPRQSPFNPFERLHARRGLSATTKPCPVSVYRTGVLEKGLRTRATAIKSVSFACFSLRLKEKEVGCRAETRRFLSVVTSSCQLILSID
jgi:hypothetical protein